MYSFTYRVNISQFGPGYRAQQAGQSTRLAVLLFRFRGSSSPCVRLTLNGVGPYGGGNGDGVGLAVNISEKDAGSGIRYSGLRA